MNSSCQPVIGQSSGTLLLNVFYQQQKRPRLCISNCRSIEVEVYITEPSPTSHGNSDLPIKTSGPQKMESAVDLPSSHDQPFPFLSLPFELRLKIYILLLPPRTHKISTQIPSNGYYYSTISLPSNTTQTFYPFGRQAPSNLTTYKVLTGNWSRDYPNPTIWPEILRTCRQAQQEGEGVLYGGPGVHFEFGELGPHGNGEAMRAFFKDRGQGARASIRRVSMAREIPISLGLDTPLGNAGDEEWDQTCSFLKNELRGLRQLNLIVWSANGKSLLRSQATVEDQERVIREEGLELQNEIVERKIRDWEWTKDLISSGSLRQARVTWWCFQDVDEEDDKKNVFDGWVARRMVGDQVVRERMVRDGRVIEGFVVVSGSAV